MGLLRHLSEIATRLKQSRQGLLHEALHQLLAKKPEAAVAICAYYQITHSMRYEDENQIIVDRFGYPLRRPIKEEITNLFRGSRARGEPDRVVRGALMLIADWELQGQPGLEPREARTIAAADNALACMPEEAVVLGLVIASEKLRDVACGPLSIELTVRLIDQAAYFGCVRRGEAAAVEQTMDLRAIEQAVPDGQSLYLDLDIEPGSDLLEEQTLYGLKQCLRDGSATRRISLTQMRILGRLPEGSFLQRV